MRVGETVCGFKLGIDFHVWRKRADDCCTCALLYLPVPASAVRATFLAGLVVVKAGGVDALGKAHVKSKVARASVCWDVGVPAALKKVH
jgi:hypothetical protein